MASESEREFNRQYCLRIKQARGEGGFTQETMAKALGIPKERYAKYENRSPMPAYLLERFSLITRADIAWLITGRRPVMPLATMTAVAPDGTATRTE